MKYRVAIDARATQRSGAGVASYSSGLTDGLRDAREFFDFIFVVESGLEVNCASFPEGATFLSAPVSKRNVALRDAWEQLFLPRQLESLGVHLYHGLDYSIPLFHTRFRKVSTMHDASVFGPYDERGLLSKARVRFLVRNTARVADAIVTDSDFSRREIVRHCPKASSKIHTVWVGVNEQFYAPLEPEAEALCAAKLNARGTMVLYYGGFKRNKNLETLLQAFRLMSRNDIYLVIAGDPGLKEPQLRCAIDRLGISERVSLYGFASNEELKVLLDKAAVFVFPSVTEGFGLPVAEAMARGVPVVCSRGGSLPEVCGDAVTYFDHKSSRDLAHVIENVLSDSALSRGLRMTAKARAPAFRWRVHVEKLTTLYLQLLAVDARRL